MNREPADVAIVGAGLAGAAAACALAKRGLRVVLLDPRSSYPPTFKAEKIEPDQVDLLRSLGLLEGLRPVITRIHAIVEGRGQQISRAEPIEQYGVAYQDFVNAVRAQLPPGVQFRQLRVTALEPGVDRGTVRAADGDAISARLLVLACGTSPGLHAGLGLEKRIVSAEHSICGGFTVAPVNGTLFAFESLTYHTDLPATRADYVTLFRLGGGMRANLFAYWVARDPWVRALSDEPGATLARLFPRLARHTGPFRVVGKAEIVPIELYGVDRPVRPGLVLIGDAYQSQCPATGTGVSKVLTDVETLLRCAPRWLDTPGLGTAKISEYYADPRKQACDRRSLTLALYRRRFATDTSIRWRMHRQRVFALSWLRDRLARARASRRL